MIGVPRAFASGTRGDKLVSTQSRNSLSRGFAAIGMDDMPTRRPSGRFWMGTPLSPEPDQDSCSKGRRAMAYTMEHLLSVLHPHCPIKVDALRKNRRRVEHGLTTVGLKIHCLGDNRELLNLIKAIGRAV